MFNRLSNIFHRQILTSPKQKKDTTIPLDRYVLVLSGGGTRGFYTLGVLKALEEAGLKDKIDAIYGISV